MRSTSRCRGRGPGWIFAVAGMLLLAAGAGWAAPGRIEQATPEDPAGQTAAIDEPAGLVLAVTKARLSPGSLGEVVISTSREIPLSAVRIVVVFDPPIFVNNPAVEFSESGGTGWFSLKSPAPGLYAIDFNAIASPINTRSGPLVKLSGVVRQDLPVGAGVEVALRAAVVPSGGASLKVDARGARLVTAPEEPGVTLQVQDAAGLAPGDEVDVVLRTYNPKPISQGQVDLLYDAAVFDQVTSIQVIGAEPDVTFTADYSTAGTVRILFASPTASINRLDGPMIVVRMRLQGSLPPGLETWIDVETAGTFLLDHQSQQIDVRARSGKVRLD